MVPKQMLFLWVCLFWAPLATAELEYPRREIDRPYLIPGHLRELRVGGGGIFSVGNTPSPGFVPVLEYESGHSENFAWLFSPIPLGFKVQIVQNDRHRLGVRAHYQVFAYGLAANYRLKWLSQAIEVEGVLDALDLFVIQTRSREIIFRPMFQITDDWVLILSGSIGRYRYGTEFLSVLFSGFSRDPAHPGFVSTNGLSAGADVQFPLSMNNDLAMDLRVGAKALYFYEGTATAEAIQSSLMLRARW